VQSKDWSLTNSDSKEEAMQQQIAEDRVTRFVENKFRVSRSYPTMITYRHTVYRFLKFLRIKYNLKILNSSVSCTDTDNKVEGSFDGCP